MSALPASLGGVGSFQTSSLTREETCSRPPGKRWWSLQFYESKASSIARVGEGIAGPLVEEMAAFACAEGRLVGRPLGWAWTLSPRGRVGFPGFLVPP